MTVSYKKNPMKCLDSDKMNNNSYLFMSRRKRQNSNVHKEMNKLRSESSISVDSLETSPRRQNVKYTRRSADNDVDTILVPFYENDVLIKIPKDQKRKASNAGKAQKQNEGIKHVYQANSYLVNNDKKSKRPTYLEMFRKQFAPNSVPKKEEKHEIRSLSPEFGDTDRENFEDDDNNSKNTPHEFFNTESYNEIYYEKLINRDIHCYLDNSFEDLQLNEPLNIGTQPNIRDTSPENLRSVSEGPNNRRPLRRATLEPAGLKLGGLGPDMEKIRPRLERARSLQRYSEKVRMENRLKIYKKTCQNENDQTTDKPAPTSGSSYLVNNNINTTKKVYQKSKSADAQKTRDRVKAKEQVRQQPAPKKNESAQAKDMIGNKVQTKRTTERTNVHIRSKSKSKAINTEGEVVPPMQINFVVNVGGARPSTALRTLEEKHRMYQEQVKAFMDSNNC